MKNVSKMLFTFTVGFVSTAILPSTVFAGGMDDQYHECPKERAEFCIEIYDPVCAVRDTGVRCIKAPCPSAEKVNFANSCKACSEARVQGFEPGSCMAQNNNQ